MHQDTKRIREKITNKELLPAVFGTILLIRIRQIYTGIFRPQAFNPAIALNPTHVYPARCQRLLLRLQKYDYKVLQVLLQTRKRAHHSRYIESCHKMCCNGDSVAMEIVKAISVECIVEELGTGRNIKYVWVKVTQQTDSFTI